MQNMIRFEKHCDMKNLILFIATYNNINKKFQIHMIKSNNRIEMNDFVRNLKKTIDYYDFDINNKNVKKKYINVKFVILNANC